MIGTPSQTDLEKIPVTPEMEEAGFRILKASGITDDYLEGDKLTLAEIYRAMHLLAPQSMKDTCRE